jgi:hypothetical protein
MKNFPIVYHWQAGKNFHTFSVGDRAALNWLHLVSVQALTLTEIKVDDNQGPLLL